VKIALSEFGALAHYPGRLVAYSTPERVMAGRARPFYHPSMQTSTSPLVELYEKRMRRFNLTVILAAMVSLVLAFLLILVA